ncbi:hypothetical protein CEXT_743391 [Caerostris extrusa]|uniref:Uncharacterized protein n=1 Tax=Caerostris extrusa TaxID=172846 RepID=A0AAV4VV62_CAEEX|nr:hypothetical protein CEXT_743391 [Caerostris extrusa]
MLLFPKDCKSVKGRWKFRGSFSLPDAAETPSIIAYYRCCFSIDLGKSLKYFAGLSGGIENGVLCWRRTDLFKWWKSFVHYNFVRPEFIVRGLVLPW